MLTHKDIEWLAATYPGLRKVRPGVIEGTLRFQMLHVDGRNYVRPSGDLVANKPGIYICDKYDVRIEWPKSSSYPMTYETGGRIQTVASSFNKRIIDMHIYPKSGALCVASPMELAPVTKQRLSLQHYVEKFLIPYLFAQSYYAKNKVWPWGELAHGYAGHLQWLGSQQKHSRYDIQHTVWQIKGLLGSEGAQELFSHRSRPHHLCLCGEGKKTRDCHPEIQVAICIIRGEISRRAVTI